MAALARGFSDRHFERGEGPGDEVVFRLNGFIPNLLTHGAPRAPLFIVVLSLSRSASCTMNKMKTQKQETLEDE